MDGAKTFYLCYPQKEKRKPSTIAAVLRFHGWTVRYFRITKKKWGQYHMLAHIRTCWQALCVSCTYSTCLEAEMWSICGQFLGQQKGRQAEGNRILVRLSPLMASRDCLKWPFSSWSFSVLNPIYMTNSVTLKLLVSSLPICHSFMTFCSRLTSFFFFFLSTVNHFFFLAPIPFHPPFSFIFDSCLCAQSLDLRKMAMSFQH